MAVTPKRLLRGGLLGFGLALSFISARGQDTAEPASPEIISRYEQILEREPEEGVSFDKLLEIFEQGDGLEKLDARWAPISAQGGAKGATYSLLRGLLADRMGRTDAARTLLQAATQAAPTDYHTWLALGDFEARDGKLPAAIDAFQKGLATPVTGEDQLALFHKLGQAQERNLDSTGALATWQKMTATFPQDTFALEEAGAAELDANQFDEARKTFQKLVDLAEPNSMARAQALMKLAGVDDRQGKTDDAVHGYEAILPLTADDSWLNREIRAQIEQVYRREDDLAGLATYYQNWVGAHPKDVDALLLWSGTLTELGKKDQALDALRKAAALAPDRHEVRQSLALGLVEAQKFDEAITVETALTADDPTEPRYWETLGEALFGKTQPPTPESKKAVLDAWSHIAPADSKDVAAILQVAELCRTHGFNDEALAGYNRALAVTPDATDIREKEAQLLVDLHRQDEAWKLLDAMAQGSAATAANDLKLAQIDDRLDRKDASAAAIQAGLALEPGNFDLLSMEWNQLAEAQKWSDAAALYDKLLAAAPNDYFADVVQGRQVQTLTSAGQLDDVEKKLSARLGGQPPLNESELGLLTRILIQQNDDDTVEKAFAEATQRFPNSSSLLQLQVDYAKHAGKSDEAVSGLRHLIALKPQQKGDYLAEIVRVRQDQQNFEEALKVAQEMIDASPASADGYLLYSDVAFAANRPDDGIAKLQVAIKLSDKPNEVRQRLAQHEMDLGQPAKARAVYDDAFAAADTPQDKLAIVHAMVPAYFQTGQIDDLIARFRQEQNAEEGGWRYGLYLSAIYDEMEDFGAARRELAKSLAVRPKDTALLHSLVDLADKEGDDAEVLRYLQMLADADPSVENERKLAEEYATQDKPADAWRIAEANQAEIMKDPLPWKDLLGEINDREYSGKLRTLLETAIRAQGSSIEGAFALAQFQLQQRDLDAARDSLWSILGMPLPPPPPPAKTSSAPAPAAPQVFPGFFGGFRSPQMSPLFQRLQMAAMAQNEYAQMAAAAQNPGSFPSRARMLRAMGQSMGGIYGMGGASTALGPQSIQDHALVYLAVMAVQQNKAADFLAELESKIAAWHWTLPQQIVAFAMIQARDPLLAALEAQAKSGQADRDLDQFCLQECGIFQQPNGDPAITARAQAAQKIFRDRLQKETPASKDQLALQQVYSSSNDATPAGIEKRKAAIHNYLATVDNKDPMAVFQAIELARSTNDLDVARQEMAVLGAMNRATWPPMLVQQFEWLPVNFASPGPQMGVIVQRLGPGLTASRLAPSAQPTQPKVDPAAKIALILDAFELGYPATQPPNVAMMTSSMPGRMGGFMSLGGMIANNGMMPANRYFTQDRITALQQVFSSLQQQKLIDEFEKQIADRAKKATDWRAAYPELMQIYVQWWNDQKDAALAGARQLLTEDPSDDNRRLVAWMLTVQQKYGEALPLLESVTARYGSSYIETQLQILHTARLANDKNAGALAAQRLLALRLPLQQQMQFMDDLRAIGMQDKANEIMQRQQAMYNRNAGAMQAAMQSVRTMQEAMNRQDKNTARDIAHQLLSHDPAASTFMGNEEFSTRAAIETLQRLGELDAYRADIEKQLAANPDSLRLNWVAAQIYEQMPPQPGQMADSTARATKYILKVAQLQPGNMNMLINFAQRLHAQQHDSEAADLYLTLLKSDINSAMPYLAQMDEAFRAAGRTKDLVDAVLAWNPPPFNPMFGGMANNNALTQLGDQMRSNGDLPDAERLYRKALAIQGPQPNDDAAAALVEIFEQEGKRDEASAEIQSLLLDQNAPAPAPILGYTYANNNWSWMFGMGWNQDGPVMPAKLRLLQMDSDLGGAPKLQAALRAKLAGGSPQLVNGLDPNQVMLVLLAIITGERDAAAQADKLVKSEMAGNTNMAVLVAEEMSLKPPLRRQAWQIVEDAISRNAPSQGNFSLMLDNMARKLAGQIGDPDLMVKTLRREISDFQEVRNANPNFVSVEQEVTFIRALVAAGLKKEAVTELALARTSPQAVSNKYISDQLDAVANEIGVGDNKTDIMPIAFGFSPGTSARTVEMSWCLGLGTNNNGFDVRTQSGEWDDAVLVRPTTQTLVVQAGDPEGRTFTTIASFPQVATRGTLPVKIPPGVSLFRALLLPQGSPVATAAPTGPAQPRTTSLALYGTGDNVLVNPDFAIGKNAAGLPTVAGWNGLWPDAITEEKGGPAPDHRYRSLSINPNGMSQVRSNPVAIVPGTAYVLSGWLRNVFNVGVILADGSGKQLEQRMLAGGGGNAAWRHFSCCIGSRLPGMANMVNLPSNAATLQLTFQGSQTMDAALLSLRPVDAAPPAASH